jgi:hypothetical protein
MARRYKSYAAETGTAYQYFFASSRRVNRPEGQGPGSDYIFVVTPDQNPPLVLRIFVSDRALATWRQAHGRDLDANEIYAVANPTSTLEGEFRAVSRSKVCVFNVGLPQAQNSDEYD